MPIERSYLVHGNLLDRNKILHEIELVIVTEQKTGRNNMAEEVISQIKFARQSPVPDGGPYILRYFFREKKYEEQVQIRQGRPVRT